MNQSFENDHHAALPMLAAPVDTRVPCAFPGRHYSQIFQFNAPPAQASGFGAGPSIFTFPF